MCCNHHAAQYGYRLYKLRAAREQILAGSDYANEKQHDLSQLQQSGFQTDYFQIYRSDDLLPAQAHDTNLVIFNTSDSFYKMTVYNKDNSLKINYFNFLNEIFKIL